jgi:hypothetical protein
MKKAFLFIVSAILSVAVVTAKPKFKRIDNNGNRTTVVLTDDNAGDSMSVSGAKFYNCGKLYDARSLNTNLKNGKAEIIMKFDRFTTFDGCYVLVTINGKEEKIPLNLGGIVR